jgi:hypothetical protein
MAGAGGSLRAGVTENPVRLTRSVKQALTRVTAGGAPCYVWPGGGITYMVDVTELPENAFGSVPTPALVAPIEFTMRLDDYARLGGHRDCVRQMDEVVEAERARSVHWPAEGIPSEASSHFDMYGNSMFDAASLGIFIGGMDPHHTGGVIQKGLRGKWSLLDYTKYSYKWEMDAQGRNIPYILGPSTTWLRINNLHIHSKDLKPCMSASM